MLADVAIRKAQKRDPAYRISDSNGLFVVVPPPAGGKCRRFCYKIGGKEKLLSRGPSLRSPSRLSGTRATRLVVVAAIEWAVSIHKYWTCLAKNVTMTNSESLILTV